MSKVEYNEEHKDILDSFLLDIPIVKPGKMYGYPAYYVGGKLFASLYMDGVCVKIPEARVINPQAVLCSSSTGYFLFFRSSREALPFNSKW